MVWNKNFFNEVKTCQKCEVVLVKDDNWGGSRDIPDDVIYYKYERDYPHHGTGNWVLF